MADYKILGSEDAVTTSVGVITEGIGFPLRPVEPSGVGQPLIAGVQEVLAADDTTTQLIPVEDVEQPILLGPAQDNAVVSLDGTTGLITFKEEGTFTLRLRLQVGRSSNTGVAWIVTRSRFNGTLTGNPIMALIDDNDFSLPLTFEGTSNFAVNDTLQFVMYRDSQESTAGDAGLFSYSTTLWGDTSSARCTITRVISTTP